VALDVRMLTVGPLQENCFLVRADPDATSAVMVDPGEEASRLIGAVEEAGVALEAILLTHCHFDHIGAVAPVARATGAEVWCPQVETDLLTDLMTYMTRSTPWRAARRSVWRDWRSTSSSRPATARVT
jgi:hydroxyacylglutathione hydrolase